MTVSSARRLVIASGAATAFVVVMTALAPYIEGPLGLVINYCQRRWFPW